MRTPQPGAALLDVNVLLALLDDAHQHHDRTQRWLADDGLPTGWASTATTQLGYLRVVSQPSYPNPVTPAAAADRLREAIGAGTHIYLDESSQPVEAVDMAAIDGHRQLTDAYLLALAVRVGARFVTLDRRVVTAAVEDVTDEHLVQL